MSAISLIALIVGSLGFGLALGLFGSGGSLLALPALTYGLGFDIKQGVVGSLVVVGVTAAFGAVTAVRRDEVCIKNAAAFLVASLPAGFGGAVVGRMMDAHWQSLAFAILAGLAGLRLLLWQVPQRANLCNPKLMPLFLSGAIVGFLTGLLGVGGGFLIVPALVILGGVGVKMARGTSLVLIAANAVAGFVGYFGYVTIPWVPLLGVVGLSVPASFVGARLAKRLPTDVLQKVFAWGLVGLGFFLMFREVRAL